MLSGCLRSKWLLDNEWFLDNTTGLIFFFIVQVKTQTNVIQVNPLSFILIAAFELDRHRDCFNMSNPLSADQILKSLLVLFHFVFYSC